MNSLAKQVARGALMVGLMAGAVAGAQAADKALAVSPVASQAMDKVTAGEVVTPAPKKDVAVPAGGVVLKNGGEKQYPSGVIVVPPRPKKEGLEAVKKAKVVQP